MSFILDALKKSESDRQREASPGIASVPVAGQPSRAPRWLPALAILLGVNVVLVLVLLLRPALSPSTAATPDEPATPVADPFVDPVVDPVVDRTPDRVADRPAENAARPAAVSETAPQPAVEREPTPDRDVEAAAPPAEAATRVARLEREPEGASAPSPDDTAGTDAPTALPADPPAAEPDEAYLTLAELRASGAFDLPDMHIDLHVYSENPADRLIFINSSQYRENATLADGPLLRSITPDGAILEYRGTRFFLPRE